MLKSSIVFDNPNFNDQIRQVEIDLENEHDIEEIREFIKDAQKYLDSNLSYFEATELFSVILSIFSGFYEQLLPEFNDYFDKSRTNANYLFLTLQLLQNLSYYHTKSNITDYSIFLSDILDEIYPQLNNQSNNLIIFGHDIPQQFQNDLILNLALLSNMKEKISSKLLKYIFYHNWPKSDENFDTFLQKFINSGLNNILPQTKSSKLEILDFLDQKNNQLFQKMSDEAFSLVECSILYIKRKGKCEIKGLNKDTILPFIAIISKFIKNDKITATFSKKPDYILLEAAAKSLKKDNSDFSNECINIIFANYNYLTKSNLFQPEKIGNFLYLLLYQLDKDDGKFDKMTYISLFLKILGSLQLKPTCINNLFESTIQFLSELTDYRYLSYKSINLKCINKTTICYYFDNCDSAEDLVQKLYFFNNSCYNLRIFPLSDLARHMMIDAFNEQLENQQFDNVLMVGRFIKKWILEDEIQEIDNNPNLPYIIKMNIFDDYSELKKEDSIDQLLLNILIDSKLEKHDFLLQNLFDLMMDDQDNLYCYLSYLVCQNEQPYDAKEYLNNFANEYNLYHDTFINVTNDYFEYNENKNVLVFKHNFKIETLPVSQLWVSIVSKIFDKIKDDPFNYQAFLCLKNIATINPTLFHKNIQQIFEIISPPLNYLYLIFDDDKNSEEETMLVKTAYATLSFTISTFYSPLILDYFINWMFENILSFSNSQILGFIHILICTDMYDNDIFNLIIIKYIQEKDFLNKLLVILDREIIEENENFREYFRVYILNLINSIFEFSNFECLGPEIIIQSMELTDSKDKITHYYSKVRSYIADININDFDLPINSDNIYREFIKEFDTHRSFWFNLERRNESDNLNYSQFCSELNKCKEFIVPEDQQFGDIFTIRMLKFLLMKPQVVANYILFNEENQFCQETGQVLIETMQQLTEMKKKASDDLLDYDDSYNYKEYAKNHFDYILSQFSLFAINLIQKLILDSNQQYILDIISSLSHYQNFIHSVFELISQKISDCSFNSSLPLIYLVNLLNKLMIYEIIRTDFNEICENNLLDVVLSSKNRKNVNLLCNTAKLFFKMQNKPPIRTIHLICFLLITNTNKAIQLAFKLCSLFDEKELSSIKSLILQKIDNIHRENIDDEEYDLLIVFCNYCSEIALERRDDFFNLLINEIYNYNNEYKSFQLICTIMNLLAPERNKSIIVTPENKIESTIPDYILQSDPEFWCLYDEFSQVINQELKQNPLLLDDYLNFLLEYPELLDFNVRFSYFRLKMESIINVHDNLCLTVDFDDILNSSFEILQFAPIDDLLKDIKIEVVGKKVIDAGGVKREWFTLLAKELFNQNYALFSYTQNKGYMPSKYSYVHENYLDYFRFSGLFIARALIEGICVDAHLNSPFCKQILNLKTNLKDLEDVDEELYKSSQWILDNDVTDLCLFFEIDVDDLNGQQTIPLKENGSNIEVTNENKTEFISLRTDFVLNVQNQQQIEAFKNGFDSLIPHDYLQLFTPNELDLLISGVQVFDVEDFERNMTYEEPYDKNTPVVRLFFQAIADWDENELASLLMFMTGSSRVPVNGFSEFVQMTGCSLVIAPGGKKENLPQAHTCMNRLDLPEYESLDELNFKIHQAIHMCNTYENI